MANLSKLLTAIVDDDVSAAKGLLRLDARLATALVQRPKLYQSGIFHWLYVGDAALHLAAAGYRVEIVKLLLAAGAVSNAAGNRRKSGPLHYAADGFITGPAWDAKRQVKTIEVLLDAGAKINAQDANGAAPLHRAVRTRCAAAVKCLLQAGADPALRNKPGSTPFHLAVQNTGRGASGAEVAKAAQAQIIREFLARGVSQMDEDGHGKTVLDCARSGWIRELLAAGNAGPDPPRRRGASK